MGLADNRGKAFVTVHNFESFKGISIFKKIMKAYKKAGFTLSEAYEKNTAIKLIFEKEEVV